jgi:hypothetical protein
MMLDILDTKCLNLAHPESIAINLESSESHEQQLTEKLQQLTEKLQQCQQRQLRRQRLIQRREQIIQRRQQRQLRRQRLIRCRYLLKSLK